MSKPLTKTIITVDGKDPVECYITNNPWKLSPFNRRQKFYRYCVLCGVNRYTDEQWGDKNWSESINSCTRPTVCDNHQWPPFGMNVLWDELSDTAFVHPDCNDDEYARLKKEESFTDFEKK